MSYSRWSNSRWYTFWSAIGSSNLEYSFPLKKLKNKQCFEICDIPSFFVTYGEIKSKGIDQILKDVVDFYSKPYEGTKWDPKEGNENNYIPHTYIAKPITIDELNELKGYINSFVIDIDEHFRLKTFFLYEWYYPSRNKVLRKIKGNK